MLAVLVNRRARAVQRDPALVSRLERALGSRGVLFATDDEAALPAVARQIHAAGATVLGLVGGDGTTMVLSSLQAAYGAAPLPRIAFLRGGTVNTVANNFGVRGRPERLLARLLDDLERVGGDGASLDARPNETLTANGRTGFLFGAAMGGRFLEAYYEDGPPTALHAATLSARTLASIFVWGKLARRLFAETPVRLVTDGEEQAIRRPRLLVAATVPDMGVGFRIAWQAGRAPGRFHLIASELSTFQLGWQSHRVLRARPLVGQPHLDRLCERVDITFEHEEPYTLDGELFRTGHVALSTGPRVEIVAL